MADLPSILGGMAQGFLDFGKSAVDLFGTGGAAVGDLVDTIRTGKVSTKNQDDFRKWLYNTDSVQDAAAKGLGTALNGVQTVSDYIPGIGAVTRNPLFNAGQGALGGLADEFKTYGKDYDLGRAGQRAAVSAGAALASGSLGDALKKSASPLLSSSAVQGLARGATGGAISGGGYAAIDGGDIAQSALQGAGMGALIGGATGAIQDFMPRKATYDMALTDEEKAARIANAKNMLANERNPERIAELNEQIKKYGGATAQPDYLGDEKYSKLVKKAKGYKSLDRFEKMNNPIKGSEIWGEKPKSYFERDSRAVRINMFPNDATKGTGLTKQYLLNMFKDAYDDGITGIVPSYGLYTKEGASFMNHLADQGWVKKSGINGYEIAPKIAEWQKTNPLADIYNAANSAAPKALENTLADADMAVNNPRYLTDENGNPRTFYHGSPNKNITEFDINQAGKNTRSGERALYFTDSPEVADEFSYERIPTDDLFVENRGAKGRVYPVNLEMNNPLDLDNLTDAQIDELWPYASYMGSWQGKDVFTRDLKNWRDVNNAQLIKGYLDMDKLASSPYDGFMARMYPNQDNQAREYAVFDNSKVKMLEDVLANDDMAVNSVPDIRASYGSYGSGNAYSTSVNRIGSKDVAPIDASTLPEGWGELKSFLRDYDTLVEKEIGKPRGKITKQDLVKALEEYGYDTDGTKDQMWRNLHTALVDNKIDDMYMNNAGTPAQIIDMYRQSPQLINPGRLSLDGNNRTARLDAEFSDRLGIGRSNTPMADTTVAVGAGGAQGDYSNGALGTDPLWATGENGISTVAHERLHSMQNEGLNWNYDEEFRDAMSELRSELAPLYHSKEEINQYWNGRKPDYYHDYDEQEARMLQDYLERKNYTQRYMNGKRSYEYDEKIIKPFDKFFDKLRDLSKRGVALPALAALFGGGAYMASQENDKEKEVK